MVARLMVVVTLLSSAVLLVCAPAFGEAKPALERPGIVDLDEPVLIDRDSLRREMRLNTNLAEYIDLYGWPDYAEIQEVVLQEPFAPYEVRLYYLKQNNYLAYGRVHIAPTVDDFGVRKFEGPIPAATLNRLLTASLEKARREAEAREAAMAPPAAEAVETDVALPEGETIEAPPAEAPPAMEEAPQAPAAEPAPADDSSEAEKPEETLS
jgi:hypothetical protein